jgi:hypothetical protein
LNIEWDEFDYWYDCIGRILSTLIPEEKLNDLVSASLLNIIRELKESKGNWSFEGFYQALCNDVEISHLKELFMRFRKDGDLGFIFYPNHKLVSFEKIDFDIKKLKTALLLTDATKVLFKVRSDEKKVMRSVIFLWNASGDIETNHNTAKYFESFVRELRKRSASLVTLDTSILTEESKFSECIEANSPLLMVGTESFNRKHVTKWYYEDLHKRTEMCKLLIQPNEECIIPEYIVFNRNNRSDDCGVVRIKWINLCS